MDSTYSDPRWWCMATVQVAEGSPDLVTILADLDYGFRLVPAALSPPGYRWFHLLLDVRRGRRRCEVMAHRLLSALQRIAETGDLPSFRIIAGERWLDQPALDIRAEIAEDADLRGTNLVS